jgi:chromosome segregation ATPase
MSDPPNPVPASTRHGSGTYQRKEVAEVRHDALMDKLGGVSETLRELKKGIDRKLDDLDGRVRHVETELAGLRKEVSSFRDLVDRVHKDYDVVRATLEKHDERLDDLEQDKARREGRAALVATGAGVGGGGLLYAIAELVRKVMS